MRRWPKAFVAGLCFSASIYLVSTEPAAALRPAPAAATASAAAANQLKVFGMPVKAAQSAAVRAGDAKLDNSLVRIEHTYAAAVAAGTQSTLDLHQLNPLAHLRYTSPLAAPGVVVDAIVKGDPKIVRAQLEKLGFKTSAVFRNDIGGLLPVDQIAKAAALSNLRFFKTAMMRTKTVTPTGPLATQGDFVQRSVALKLSALYPGLTGAGLTVGLMSDSFDCAGVANQQNGTDYDDYATDVALGALPAGVNVIEEDPGCPDGTDEGRALAQIVYAVAPGAQLAFYTADGSEADFAQGILTLALPTSQTDPNGLNGGGAQIIDDDVGYYDEPVFQEGEVGMAVDQVASGSETVNGNTITFPPVMYFSSAGNEGHNSYENAAPQFTGTAAANAPNAGETLLNMDTSGATSTYYLPITIPPLAAGDSYVISLFWDQPYQSGYPNDPGDVIGDPGVANGAGAVNVLDFCVGDTSGNVPSSGTIGPIQVYNGPLGFPTNCAGPSDVAPDPASGYTTSVPGEKDPYNFLEVYNPNGTTSPAVQASLVVGLISGTPPGRVKILIQDDGRGTQITQFNTASSTIQGHPLSPNAMATGATFFYDTPACQSSLATPIEEDYSSAGGSPFLFDVNGNPLTPPVYPQKPDIVAPDGVTTTFFGFPAQNAVDGSFNTPVPQCQLNAQYPYNFFGTSAAGPHAAGAAALLLQADPSATPAQIYAALESTAEKMGTTPGFNYNTGFGLIQVDAAAAALLPAVLTLSPTSFTFTSAGSQTETVTNSGTGPLTVSNVQVTPSGITAANNCPATVAAGASCTIVLTAVSASANSGALTFSTNAQGLGGSASVPISIPAQITLAPQTVSLQANQGGSASQAVTVSNSGLGPLTISSIQVSPALVSETDNCNGTTLAAGASCTVTLTLVTTTTGSGLGTLSVGSNAPGGTASVPVSATVNANSSGSSSGGAFGPWLLLPGFAMVGLRRRRRRA